MLNLTEDEIEEFATALEEGAPPAIAAAMVGLQLADVLADEVCAKLVARKEAKGIYGIFKNLREQAEKGNVKAATFLLERRDPTNFGPPKQVLEQRRLNVNVTTNLPATPVADFKRLSKEELAQLQVLHEKAGVVIEGTFDE